MTSNKKRIQPVYLLAGGPASDKKHTEELYRTIFKKAVKASPKIAYIGVANEDDSDFFNWISASFKSAGAAEVTLVPLAIRHHNLTQAMDVINNADLIFLSGGDVDLGMRLLEERKMVAELREQYRNGKTFFGSSAGSIILANKWLRWPDIEDEDAVELFDCLGLAKVLCDTHAEDDGWEELRELMSNISHASLGYGIPSNSALQVFSDGRVKAIGGPIHRLKVEGEEINRIADLV